MTVTLDGSASHSLGGAITSWDWDLGDGATATGPSVTHTYDRAGSFVAVLTVTDDTGATDTVRFTFTVEGPVPEAPSIVSQPADVTVEAGEPATFAVEATGTPPLGYQWYRDGLPVPGADDAELTTGPTDAADDDAAFTVEVTGLGTTATSDVAVLTVTDPPPPPPIDDDWFSAAHEARLPIEVAAGRVVDDDVVVVPVTLDPEASVVGLRVVEVAADGETIVDPAVAFQFDPASDFASTGDGELVLLLDGAASSTTRSFHLYVDLDGDVTDPAVVAPLVELTTGVQDEGADALQIDTPQGTWWFDRPGGGFSSLVDLDGNDWLTYSSATGSAGEFRGIPNLVFPEGHLHPGATSSTTSVLLDGPLRTAFTSVTDDGWEVRWDVLPTRAIATVVAAPRAYWFLYEGTPGGLSDPETDTVVRPDGTVTGLGESWVGDLPGEEWVGFVDGPTGRALVVANEQADDAVDSYRLMNGEMTVFGFGRRNTTSSLEGTQRRFAVALVEDGEDLGAAGAAAVATPQVSVADAESRSGDGNRAPRAVATADPVTGTAPLLVRFDGSTSTDDGTITAHAWTLGDGATATDPTALHTYTEPGTYAATLTVTDDAGATDTDTVTIEVRNPDAGDQRVTDGLLALYDLEEGTGTTVLDRAGRGPALDLTITEPDDTTWVPGGLRLDAATAIVSNGPATAVSQAIATSSELTVEAWIEAGNLTQNGPARIVTISDGIRDRNLTLGQGVSNDGSDRVEVRVRSSATDDNGRPATATGRGTLDTDLTHVVATRSADGTTRIYLDGVARSVGSVGGSLASWDDSFALALGNEPDGSRPWLGTLHLVALYDRALTAGEVEQNALAGPSGDAELPNRAPIASLGSTSTRGPAPLTVTFDGSGSTDPDGSVVAHAWDLGDGTSASGPVVEHTFVEPGTYDVTLTVTDDEGATTSDTVRITATEQGGGSIGGSGPVEWRRISTDDGTLPFGLDQRDQTVAAAFDVNGDGIDDMVIGGRRDSSGPSLVWYELDGDQWVVRTIEPDLLRLEAGGTFADIDDDGDLDLVIGEDLTGNRLFWWENPAPTLDQRWTRREIKSSGSNKHHDQAFGDVDGDGDLELLYWNQQGGNRLFFAEIPTDPTREPWPATQIFSRPSAAEGLDIADIDLDGVDDVVGAGFWLRWNSGTTFTAFEIDASQAFTRAAAAQLIDGGRPEVVFDSGDAVGPLRLYEWDGSTWVGRTILESSEYGHSLDVGDVNGDGQLDLLTAEIGLSDTVPDTRILYGDGTGEFTEQLVASGVSQHESRLADLDGDGDLDLFGKPFRPRGLNVWWNDGVAPLPLDDWVRSVPDSSVPWRTIFVEHGDLDGDGFDDVVSGGWWWRNPGSLDGTWVRSTIGAPLNQMAVVADLDGDGDLDVLGTEAEGSRPNSDLAWAENDGTGSFTVRTNITPATGRFLQGAVAVELVPGVVEVALSWEDGEDGLQVLTVPSGSAIRTGTWTRRIAHPTVYGEELSVGDIDGDGDADLFDGEAWFRNDGGLVTRIVIHSLPGEPDRNRLVDVDGDGDLDAVVGFAHDPDGKVRWFEQGDDPTEPWTPHTITDVGPAWASSLDVGDLDGDGDVDVVVGEHLNPDTGSLGQFVLEQVDPDTWVRHLIHRGDEHHDGTQLADFDLDGDLDVVSIGWTHRRLHLYENQAR
ncbi:MAG: PKD domain-containing protein [Actinomycetota bacterium]